jgi:hypothetical protein
MSLAEYWDELNRHDWYYPYSDDHRVWLRGVKDEQRLEAIAKESPAHQELYDKFAKHHFSGAPWGTEKQPLPPQPVERH